MSRPSIVAIAGSLSKPSRTRAVVDEVASRIQARTNAGLTTVDVAELAPDIGRAFVRPVASPKLEAALRAIETADLVVAGSPIWKGSYTGFFKHLVDLVDYRALRDTPVAILATGGSDRHALSVEHQMRPLFASFDAHVLPTAVFVAERDVVDGAVVEPATRARLDRLVAEATRSLVRVQVAA